MPPANPARRIDEHAALRAVVQGTAGETGQAFYGALVENLARALNMCGAWLTEYFEDRGRLRALAFWIEGERFDGLEYDIRGTVCEMVIKQTRLVHISDDLLEADHGRPDDAGHADLPADDGGMAGTAAPIGDDSRGHLHGRFPIRVGHIGY